MDPVGHFPRYRYHELCVLVLAVGQVLICLHTAQDEQAVQLRAACALEAAMAYDRLGYN